MYAPCTMSAEKTITKSVHVPFYCIYASNYNIIISEHNHKLWWSCMAKIKCQQCHSTCMHWLERHEMPSLVLKVVYMYQLAVVHTRRSQVVRWGYAVLTLLVLLSIMQSSPEYKFKGNANIIHYVPNHHQLLLCIWITPTIGIMHQCHNSCYFNF